MTLDDALDRCERILRDVWQIFHGAVTSIGPRTQPLLAYVALALEHQESIILLIRRQHFGSALALFRPVVEIMWRSGWTACCATDAQVDQMRRTDFKFPDTPTLVKNLDQAFETDVFFREHHKALWATLNSYTHGGLAQLASRFTDLQLTPSYPEEEMLGALYGSLISTALTVTLVLKMHSRTDDAAKIEALLIELGKQLPHVPAEE